MSSQRTVAGSLSSQCVQALKEKTEGLSPLAKSVDIVRLTPLVPEGLTEAEEGLRTRAWLQCFVNRCVVMLDERNPS